MWTSVLVLLLCIPLTSAKCVSIQDVAFQDQFFYDIYSTVVPSDHATQFYAIVHNSSVTKAQILTNLNDFCDQVGGIMLDAERNSLQHQTERINTANNLIQSSSMSEQAKNFAQQNADNIYNMGQTWAQTCQANNRLIEEQPQAVLNEVNANTNVRSQIQMFINTQCMSTLEKQIAQRRYQSCGNNNQMENGDQYTTTSGYNGWWNWNNGKNGGSYDYGDYNTGNGQYGNQNGQYGSQNGEYGSQNGQYNPNSEGQYNPNSGSQSGQYNPYSGNQNGQYNPNSGSQDGQYNPYNGNQNGDFYPNTNNQNGNYKNGKRHKGHHHRGNRGGQGQYSNNGGYGYQTSNNGGYFNGYNNEYPQNPYNNNNGFGASFYPQFVDGAKNKAPSKSAPATKPTGKKTLPKKKSSKKSTNKNKS
ncbi:hypothetical protein M3Y95_01129600 [Aphelenchoides besseyi]|nr:hypothetical protein M3Y95_01129600 [Aphelenchoides besseyi]